jgi:hypothetical protein
MSPPAIEKSETDQAPDVSESKMKMIANTSDAWLNVLSKFAALIALGILLLDPQWIPLLKRFVIKSSEINIMGSKIQIVDVSLSGGNVEVKDDGRLFVAGMDVNSVGDTVDKLNQQVTNLTQQASGLVSTIGSMKQALADAIAQRDQANDKLKQLASHSSEATPVATGDLDSSVAKVIDAAKVQIASSEDTATQAKKVVSEIRSVPAVGYGVVFSADKDLPSADFEIAKAEKLTAGVIILYRRQNWWRGVAYHAERAAASAELQSFKSTWPEAYIVEIASWCPKPTVLTEATRTSVEQKDCGF